MVTRNRAGTAMGNPSVTQKSGTKLGDHISLDLLLKGLRTPSGHLTSPGILAWRRFGASTPSGVTGPGLG